jgi:hypothetical protein
MTEEFDPTAIMQYRPTEEEAAGRSPLPPEGNYENCELVDLQVFPPSDKFPKPGVLAVLKATFTCENYDGELVKRLNFKKPLSRRSALWKLMNSVWGDDMKDHTPEELLGIKTDIFITHEWTNGANPVKYAEFKYIQK